MEVMTLEQMRDLVWSIMPITDGFDAAFDAAIRERDERDASMRTMQDLTREVCIAREAVHGLNVRLADCMERAQKAESELAALRKRIAEAPVVSGGDIAWGCGVPTEWTGKRVWRLVEDDDES